LEITPRTPTPLFLLQAVGSESGISRFTWEGYFQRGTENRLSCPNLFLFMFRIWELRILRREDDGDGICLSLICSPERHNSSQILIDGKEEADESNLRVNRRGE
jgi:hypothetical protein